MVCPSWGLPVLRQGSTWGHAVSPVLLWAPPGTPKPPWEAQQGHADLSAQLFWVTLAASCASKPSLNERVEVLGSHGHLSLVNHPWSLPSSGSCSLGSVCFVAAGSLVCGSQSQAARPLLPRCKFGLLWNGRKWRSWSVEGFGHERWKMWITGIPVLSLLEITGSTYQSAWLAESLKKQGGALEIKQTFYNQEHILYPAQPLQVSHPFRRKGVAGVQLIIPQFNFGVEQRCEASGLLNPANNAL